MPSDSGIITDQDLDLGVVSVHAGKGCESINTLYAKN